MNTPTPHGESPQAALLRRGNDYAEFERQREARERVEPHDPPPHPAVCQSDGKVFHLIRTELDRFRYWSGDEHNSTCWCTSTRPFSAQQRAWFAAAADRLQECLDEMNQQLKERS